MIERERKRERERERERNKEISFSSFFLSKRKKNCWKDTTIERER